MQNQAVTIENVQIKLSLAYTTPHVWLGSTLTEQQLQAAWLKINQEDLPMNPRVIGRPGVGKTTLAISVAQKLGLPVFMLQGTADLRPEDLIITPVLNENRMISYVASPLVSAMILGGVCILDEGNRMPEKTWASLVPLLDHRRYVDSLVAGIRIPAHPEFRFITTMNDDSSVFDLPEYIQSRLSPQLMLNFPSSHEERQILKSSVPYASNFIVEETIKLLANCHEADESYSIRDGIQIAQFAEKKLKIDSTLSPYDALMEAIISVLGPDGFSHLNLDKIKVRPTVSKI